MAALCFCECLPPFKRQPLSESPSSLCRTVFFWHGIVVGWLFKHQNGRILTLSLMNKLMRLLLLNHISPINMCLWETFSSLLMLVFFVVIFTPFFSFVGGVEFLYFSWNTSALKRVHANLDTPAQVLLWRAAPWPVKEAGRRRQRNGRVGWGDSHSVDPQSVTCLKRESGERTHGAKVQEAAWLSLKSETQRREPTVKERSVAAENPPKVPKFLSFCWTCPEWSPSPRAKVSGASVCTASAAQRKEMTTGCRAGGKVIQVEGRQGELTGLGWVGLHKGHTVKEL